MTNPELRMLVRDIAEDYKRQATLPIDHEAARLIAAAPELLEELQRFHDYYAQRGRSAQLGNGEALQHFTRAHALLARLEDRS